jgi:hypothetical protein
MHPFTDAALDADETPLYAAARALELLMAAEIGRWKSGVAYENALVVSSALLCLTECAPDKRREERARKFRHELSCIDDSFVMPAFRDKRGDETSADERRAAFVVALDALRAQAARVYSQPSLPSAATSGSVQ